MQKAVLIRKPCQRAHQNGQEQVISVCLNKDCQTKLSCVNCLRDGYHKDHPTDLCHFDFLQVQLEKYIADYHNSGVLTLINQKIQEFNLAKSAILKTLDLLEADFLRVIQRVSEVDQCIRESIKMVQAKDYLPIKEFQAQVFVYLKDSCLTEILKRLVATSIIQELQSFNKSLKNKLESTQIDQFLKKHFQDPLQAETFQNKRLNYDFGINMEMKLIIEEQIGELNEGNLIYLGGFQDNLKHGRGIQIKRDCQEIWEGVWEKDTIKWGQRMGILNKEIAQIYVGSFKNGNYNGIGIENYSNGDIYEGEFNNGNREGKGVYKYYYGGSYEGDFKNGKYEGKGVEQYSNGGSYEGDYKNDKKEGKGIEKYANGGSYEGDYKNDKKEGKGIFKYFNKDSYEGEYINDKKEGNGVYRYASGENSKGLYKDGFPVDEHQFYKPTCEKPYKIYIYGVNGNVKEVKLKE